jgi:bacteriocin-like protein
MNTQFQTLSDAELEQVAGGVGISLTLDESGAKLAGPLGELSIPSPLALIGDAVSGLFGLTGDLFKATGGAFTAIGGLFDVK